MDIKRTTSLNSGSIGIINYGMGNLKSIQNALEYLGIANFLIEKPKDFFKCSKLILPGVGSFNQAIKNLNDLKFIDEIKESVLIKEKPILGICLGMQIMAEIGEEDGISSGLSLIPGIVSKFNFETINLKIPHIGFNKAYFVDNNSTLFKGLGDSSDFYFVHSYKLSETKTEVISSYCEYGEKFVSSISYKNIHGTQFHPEKSQNNGLIVLKNFVSI